MTSRRCTHCGQSFVPRPQVRDQAYCAAPECQRARKRRWQCDRLRADPAYRANQRDAQRAWQQRNPDYWRQYREQRPRRATPAVKMDVCGVPAGLYRIRPLVPSTPVGGGVWVVALTPVCHDCPRKMDVCKERT